MSDPGSYCVCVYFVCICCMQEIRNDIEKCNEARLSWATEKHSSHCYPTIIRAASRVLICTDCCVQTNLEKEIVSLALSNEAQKIGQAYFETFEKLECWGYKVKGHEDVRIGGIIWWMKVLQEIVKSPTVTMPLQAGSRMHEDIAKLRTFFGGQKSFKSKTEATKDGMLENCAKSISGDQDKIMDSTGDVREALEEKGFKIEGVFFQLLPAINNESSMGGNAAALPDGDFWKWKELYVFMIVWKLEDDGQPVEVTREALIINRATCQCK